MSIIRLRGNHRNYEFLTQYFNTCLMMPAKPVFTVCLKKQTDTVLASLEFIVCNLCCLYSKSFVSMKL